MENINDLRYRSAKERVECLRSFYGSLFWYCLIIPLLAFINYRTSSFMWFVFPAIGWGIGLVAHGLRAYGYNPLFGKNWEERKTKEFMDKDRN